MPKLIADCPNCGGPVYDLEGQTKCPSCKAELPGWFANIEPEYSPANDSRSIIRWIEEKAWKIEFHTVPTKHWVVALNNGAIFKCASLRAMLSELRQQKYIPDCGAGMAANSEGACEQQTGLAIPSHLWDCPSCKESNQDTRKSFVLCAHCGSTFDSMPGAK